jgi:hypothetical protein
MLSDDGLITAAAATTTAAGGGPSDGAAGGRLQGAAARLQEARAAVEGRLRSAGQAVGVGHGRKGHERLPLEEDVGSEPEPEPEPGLGE